MMPFAERWGLRAVEFLSQFNFLASEDLNLVEGSMAWLLACELQKAHDVDEAYVANIRHIEATACAGVINEDCFKPSEIYDAIMKRAKAHAKGKQP